jgi:putative flavoprotein involved in K+ transport
VHLSVGSRQIPLPQRLLGRDLFGYLDTGRLKRLTVQSRLGRRPQYRDALIGSSPRTARRRHGIALRGGAVEASGTEVRFPGRSALTPQRGDLGTGFALDHSLVQAPIFDEAGRVEHHRGVTAVPGLYFLGLPGSTPAAQPSWAGSRTTRGTAPRRSPAPRRASPTRPAVRTPA